MAKIKSLDEKTTDKTIGKYKPLDKKNKYGLKVHHRDGNGNPIYTCDRVGCGNQVLYPRRKYCSKNCLEIVTKDNAAARARRREAAIAAKGGDKVATRTCLSCSRYFLSEGPWNRICPKCAEKKYCCPSESNPCLCKFTTFL